MLRLLTNGRSELWVSSVSHTDAASTAGASTPRWELHDPNPKGGRGTQREGRREREGRRREKRRADRPRTTGQDGHEGTTNKTNKTTTDKPNQKQPKGMGVWGWRRVRGKVRLMHDMNHNAAIFKTNQE